MCATQWLNTTVYVLCLKFLCRLFDHTSKNVKRESQKYEHHTGSVKVEQTAKQNKSNVGRNKKEKGVETV